MQVHFRSLTSRLASGSADPAPSSRKEHHRSAARHWMATIATWLALGTAAAFVSAAASPTDAVAAQAAHGKKHKAKAAKHAKAKHKAKGKHAGKGGKAPAPDEPDPAPPRPIVRTQLYPRCPAEMVSIRGQYCIDRWEASTIDASSGKALSPYYPPHGRLALWSLNLWTQEVKKEHEQAATLLTAQGTGSPTVSASLTLLPTDQGVAASSLPAAQWRTPSVTAVVALPELPPWQREGRFAAKAISKSAVVPQGYTPGFVAEQACRAAGKRLCREEEWVQACKGEQGTKFPYGNEYRQGACNVFREDHPAHLLHGSASEGLSDPRLNIVMHDSTDLLRETGGSPLCRSVWGSDALYDMVGNLDEWVDDPDGLFVGGFYSRGTRSGCEARVSAHPTSYFDYSTGFRCCADLVQAQQGSSQSQAN